MGRDVHDLSLQRLEGDERLDMGIIELLIACVSIGLLLLGPAAFIALGYFFGRRNSRK